MKFVSIAWIAITSLLIMPTMIKAQKIEGAYPFNSKKYIGEARFTVRKDGNLKAELAYLNPAKTKAFYAVANSSNTYESERLRIVAKSDEAFVMYQMSSRRYVEDVLVFAKNKKALKALQDEMGLTAKKKSSKEGLADVGAFFGGAKADKAKKKRPDVKDLQFIAFNPSSKFHEEQVGKLVFFSERPVIGQEDLTKVKTSFKIGEPVWAALYLPTSIEHAGVAYNGLVNQYQDPNTGKMHYYLNLKIDQVDEDLLEDEKEVCWGYSVHKLPKGTNEEKDCFVFQVLPGIKDFNMYRGDAIRVTQSFADKLGTYKHTLRATLSGSGEESKLFIGEFEYDASEGKAALEEYAQKIKNSALEDKELPKPAMNDANLEAAMQQQAQLYANNRGWSSQCTKAIIVSSWSVLTRPDGTIIGKYIQAYCVFNDPAGKECSYINFGFLKEHEGGGQYSNSIRQYDIGFRGAISCDKAQ